MTPVKAKLGLALFLLAGCASAPLAPVAAPSPTVAEAGAWPQRTARPLDAAMERRIAGIVAGMSLEQKVGQMTQPDIRNITAQEVSQYHIGSVLNGGGAWPNNNKAAPVSEWADQAIAYTQARVATDGGVVIPVIWGTDAVHGHNNVRGATLFPHNIGLGAANDPDLIRRIGRATAQQVRATGITWVFAPTVAVGQNRRWGRSYESYSSDPALVSRYATAMVEGLQGDLRGGDDVVATAKHFLGDGGTFNGVDQGETRATEAEMARTHAAGYYAALDAGVETVMATYNSWNDQSDGRDYGKLHGSREVLTGILRDRMAFDGLLVSDWNGIEQVAGCRKDHCPQAINAGLDLIMVPEDWKAFITNTVGDVNEGRIPMARIDEAVTRILRTKIRTGLFDQPASASPFNGRQDAVQFRDLAREAVRKSVVLLKNENAALPLRSGAKVLVVGASADSLSNQSGGWSLTWQGTENTNEQFGGGSTVLNALRETLGADNVVFSVDGAGVDPSQFSAVIAVLGETPYAEYNGDVRFPTPVQHSLQHPADLAALRAVSGKGAPVITVLYSGRPSYANDLINLSDAFVAGFLPGTEGGSGLVDLLMGGRNDFTGRLSFVWPGSACSTGEGEGQVVQFPRGYGLSYRQSRPVGPLPLPATPATCQN